MAIEGWQQDPPRYERVLQGYDISQVSIEAVLAELGIPRPTIRTHQHELPIAVRLNIEHFHGWFNVEIDPMLQDSDEWYIEFNGRRVGSEGA